MKWIKRILIIVSNIILLNVASQCLAATNENAVYSKNGENYIDRIYLIKQEDEKEFLKGIENEIVIDDVKYIYFDTIIKNQDSVDVISIETTKECVLKTNNKHEIIQTLGKTIQYNENGYVGNYVLDENSINIESINNGYYDKLIENTVEYTDLEKNDLSYIPKQIEYDNKLLDLLNTKWEVIATDKIEDKEIPSKYKAICYYATKERIYRPNTYTVSARYKGNAEKNIEQPLKITVTYKEKKEEKISENKNNIIPILGGTSGIIIFLGGLLIFRKNVKIYNLQNGKWIYVGKAVLQNGKIKLDRFKNIEITNKYRIELSKKLARKYKDKTITIYKGTNSVKQIIRTSDSNIDFEIRI